MSGRAKAAFGILLLAALCAGVFLVPSAWIAHRGWPRWLSLAVGLLAFPAVPVGWHLWRERGRKKAGTEGALTARDRFLLRVLAVALVVVAPLLVFDRAGVWSALKHDSTWFLRWGGPPTHALTPPGSDPRMLDYVPADAEAIGWLRSVEHLQRGIGGESASDTDAPDVDELLIAVSRDGVAFVVRGETSDLTEAELERARSELGAQSFLPADQQLVMHRPADDLLVVATSGWDDAVRARIDGSASAPAELVALLDDAGDEAFFIAVARPTEPIAGVEVASAVGAVTVVDETLSLEATLVTAPGGAPALRTAALTEVQRIIAGLPDDCAEARTLLRDAVDVGGTGDTVSIRANVPGELLVGLVFCGISFDE